MTKQEKLDHTTHQNRQFPRLAATAATFLVAVMMGHTAKGYPGDQWILPIHHVDSCGSGCTVFPGEGYDGTDAVEGWGWDAARRVYWALNGLSLTTSNVVPTTTEQYTIEWFQTTVGASDWQPIESQFRGVDGEIYPYDPKIPWAGAYGTSHQWIGAEGIAGDAGHLDNHRSRPAHAEQRGLQRRSRRDLHVAHPGFMALRQVGFRLDNYTHLERAAPDSGDRTYTRPVIESVSKSGDTVTLTWRGSAGRIYQVQYKTNLTQLGWSNLGGTIPGTSPTTTASDVNPPDASRFYRVEMLP